MNSKPIHKLLMLAASLCLTGGCKTVIRENIISSVETGVGITIAENPKTELYEVKAGFIRNQFYSIPTGKRVESPEETITTVEGGKTTTKKSKNSKMSNKANITPELVSGIKTHSGAEHLFLGMDVSESFAVGSNAVMSPAATAMYVAQAKGSDPAGAAADAATAVATGVSFTEFRTNQVNQRATLEELKKIYREADPAKQEKIRQQAESSKVVPSGTKPANFLKELTKSADNTPEATSKLRKLLEDIQQ